MGLFKKLMNENIMFTKKGDHKYKLILNLERKSQDSIIIHYVDDKIKHKIKITENSLDDYDFIKRTKNFFYKKYIKLDTQTINEMVTGDAGVGGSEGADQFSADTYAKGDARNIFGTGNTKFPITRRPKIKDTLMKNVEDKDSKKKKKKKKTSTKKKIIKEYFIGDAKAFVMLRGGHLIPVKHAHLDTVLDYFDDLEDEIHDVFEDTFGEPIDMSNDHDMDVFNEYVKDFMETNNVFAVVMDQTNKEIHVRPNNGKKPSQKQIKELKDWAIENNYDTKIIFDMAIA